MVNSPGVVEKLLTPRLLNFPYALARRYVQGNTQSDYDDLVGQGNLGLVSALRIYDKELHGNLIGHVYRGIIWAFGRPDIYVNREKREESKYVLSLDYNYFDDSTLYDFVTDSKSFERKIESEDMIKFVDEKIGKLLKPLEKRVLEDIYHRGMTILEISQKIINPKTGISYSKALIGKTKLIALEKLRNHFIEKGMLEDLYV
jgi:DNA-directed RNA polymerase specialized sigma subunit